MRAPSVMVEDSHDTSPARAGEEAERTAEAEETAEAVGTVDGGQEGFGARWGSKTSVSGGAWGVARRSAAR